MIEKKLSAETKKLIHNNQFILWCLSPSEELSAIWAQWKVEHPDLIENMDQAHAIVCSTQLNAYKMPPTQSIALEKRLLESISIKQQKKTRKIQMYTLAAASAVILLFLIGTWMILPKDTEVDLPVLFAESSLDSSQIDVELILDNQQTMLLENRTNIQFDTNGSIFVDKKQKSIQTSHLSSKNIRKAASGHLALNILKVPLGRRSSLLLSDGTRIWANSGTVVQFPSVFEAEDRTIYVDGEIFLEVAEDSKRPFYVRTSKMDVRVFGTSFDVSAFKNEENQSVVLCKGSVEVDNRSGRKSKITPSEMLTITGNTMAISKVDTYNYTFWVDETFNFENRNLSEVMKHLSRYYHMNVECSAEVKNLICSGKLILFDDIENVMNTLSESLPISYKIKENNIKISNKKLIAYE